VREEDEEPFAPRTTRNTRKEADAARFLTTENTESKEGEKRFYPQIFADYQTINFLSQGLFPLCSLCSLWLNFQPPSAVSSPFPPFPPVKNPYVPHAKPRSREEEVIPPALSSPLPIICENLRQSADALPLRVSAPPRLHVQSHPSAFSFQLSDFRFQISDFRFQVSPQPADVLCALC
jgi:hypothetical protein